MQCCSYNIVHKIPRWCPACGYVDKRGRTQKWCPACGARLPKRTKEYDIKAEEAYRLKFLEEKNGEGEIY